ncbi:MAG: hypothetical protein V1781_08080 [Bacteroidota bacterium]
MANQLELVKLHLGKYLVIKDEKVIGSYDSREQTLTETTKTHPLGTFLVQLCSPGDTAYSQTFHSRVIYFNNV